MVKDFSAFCFILTLAKMESEGLKIIYARKTQKPAKKKFQM